jgi:hypothetical protein
MNQFTFNHFVPEASVEGFDKRIIGWNPGPREIRDQIIRVGPSVECFLDELEGTGRICQNPGWVLDRRKLISRHDHQILKIANIPGCDG